MFTSVSLLITFYTIWRAVTSLLIICLKDQISKDMCILKRLEVKDLGEGLELEKFRKV